MSAILSLSFPSPALSPSSPSSPSCSSSHPSPSLRVPRPDSHVSLLPKPSRSLVMATAVPEHPVSPSSSVLICDILPQSRNDPSSSHKPRKLRKLSRPPPTSYRPSSSSLFLRQNLDLNLYIPPLASSSAIAHATASMNYSLCDQPSLPADSLTSSDLRGPSHGPSSHYPNTSSAHGSSNTSTSSSLARSVSMSSPRKLTKPHAHINSTPPLYVSSFKSEPLKRNFSPKDPFPSKTPSSMQVCPDLLPPLLSTPVTSPSPYLSTLPRQPIVLQTEIEFTRTPSPPNVSEHSHFDSGLASDNGLGSTPSSLHNSPMQKRKQGGGRSEGTNLMRRWSLLEIPDEVLAVEFEEMRRVTKLKERRRSFKAKSENHSSSSPLEGKVYTPGAFVYGGPPSSHRFWLGGGDDEHGGQSDDDQGSDVSEGDWGRLEDDDPGLNEIEGKEQEERGWKRTRRALFCCRELIRTEKNYFTRLIQLLDGKTLTPPPTLLVTYLPALIVASNTLLEKFSQDPTAYGISKGFVDTEILLENALVAYCGVVGDVFTNRRSEKRKLVRSSRRDSITDNGLVMGVLGQNLRGSRLAITEELVKPQHQQQIDERRESAPADFSRKAHSKSLRASDAHTLPRLDRLDKEKSGLGGGLKRTMSLFKRKSLPPLPTLSVPPRESHSGPPSPLRSRTPSIFSLTPIVSRGSLMSLALGMGGTSRTPSFTQPSPRRHAKSEPVPPPVVLTDHQAAQFPVSRVSSIGHVEPQSVHGQMVASSLGHDDRGQGKIPTARDLAILPPQRATRFVLLFRDLLNHTPENSPTRPLVERALEGAIRIAEKCDRAQGNAAFLRRS